MGEMLVGSFAEFDHTVARKTEGWDSAANLVKLAQADHLHQRVIHAFEDWCKANLPVSMAEIESALAFSKAAHDAIERGVNPFA